MSGESGGAMEEAMNGSQREELNARGGRLTDSLTDLERERNSLYATLKALVESIYHKETRGVTWTELKVANEALGQWCAICRLATHNTNAHAVEVTA
jgi:hypothetical protein